jgi:membrane protein YfhO
VALVLCLFPGAVFLGRTLYFRDIHLQWYGQIESFVRTVGARSWPLWDLYTSFGQPLLGNANSQLFYPLTWLNLVVRPPTYFTIYVVLHCLFSGLGLYAFCRRLGISGSGSWVAAAAWTASGPLLSLVNLWNHFAGAAWIPWVMLAADRALVRGRPVDALLWGGCLAAQILCGSPDMFALTCFLVGGYALRFVRWRDPGHAETLRLLATVLMAAGLALGLSAAQWIPSLDLVRQSARSSLPEDIRAAWSLHPANLLQIVVPLAWDDPAIAADERAALFEGREPLLASIYLGMPAVGLVAAALARRPRSPAAFFILVAAVSAVVAMGYHSPAYELAMRALPPLKMLRYPSKAIVVAGLGWAVLAGQGFDSWSVAERGRLRDWRSRVLGPLLVVVALGVSFAIAIGHGVVRAVVLSTGLTALVSILALNRRGGRRAAVAAAALVVADLILVNRGLNPTAPRDFYKFRPPVLESVTQEDGRRLYVYDYVAIPGLSRRHLGRDAPYRMFLPPGTPKWAEAWGMRAYLAGPFAGGHGLYGSYSEDILRIHPRPLALLTEALLQGDGTPFQLRLLRLGAVSDVIALHSPRLDGLAPGGSFPGLFPEPVRLFHVRDPLPRAYVVSGARVADGPSALAALADVAFDPAREVVLSEGSPAPISPTFSGTTRILALRPDGLRLDAELSEPGYLVLVDAYGPGWRATVDGEGVSVLRANLAFRAVRVGAGRHVIEQVYRPRSVGLGLLVSGATLAAAVWVGARGRSPIRVRSTLDTSPVPR